MKKIYVLVFLCVVTASVYAQKLSGVITDAFTREPLIGVSILNTDNGTGTVTDLDGHYELLITTLPAHLQFSYVGYQTEDKVLKTIPAKYDLVLQADNEVLDEVVVTAGRFEQRMTDVTVSMEVVKPQLIRSQAPTDLSATLQTLPGVEIIDKQPSIRGGGGWTYSVGSRCQVLMDEMTILNPKTGEINWNNVPLENVAQVEVVKGASSVLYGSSALNGVINVRTQRPGLTPQTLSFKAGFRDGNISENFTVDRETLLVLGREYSYNDGDLVFETKTTYEYLKELPDLDYVRSLTGPFRTVTEIFEEYHSETQEKDTLTNEYEIPADFEFMPDDVKYGLRNMYNNTDYIGPYIYPGNGADYTVFTTNIMG